MEEQQFLQLLEKVSDGTATEKELALYLEWCKSFEKKQHSKSVEFDTAIFKTELLQSIQSKISSQRKPLRSQRMWYRLSAAAILLATLSASIIFFFNQKTNHTSRASHNIATQSDIAPGGNKAVLTLANGEKINLSDAANGQLLEQAGIKITKTTSGQLVYAVSKAQTPGTSNTDAVTYNTVATPKGGQYQINLPDGTRVYLNANSSLHFPTTFAGNKREVDLKGEAYFEVAKNAKMPFKVHSTYQTIEVLGTHFNVNAYEDEPAIKTTLLEGSVKVVPNNSSQFQLLEPNQQASLNPNNNALKVTEVDTEEAIAWKNGNFLFQDEDLKSIMRKVCRWYDVDVTYKGTIDGSTFSGIVSRSKNVSEIIKIIEQTSNYKIKIEERRLIVMP